MLNFLGNHEMLFQQGTKANTKNKTVLIIYLILMWSPPTVFKCEGSLMLSDNKLMLLNSQYILGKKTNKKHWLLAVKQMRDETEYGLKVCRIRLIAWCRHWKAFWHHIETSVWDVNTTSPCFFFVGTATLWVMGDVIDDGIAHNHPLLYGLPLISIRLLRYPSALREWSEFTGANCAQRQFRVPHSGVTALTVATPL